MLLKLKMLLTARLSHDSTTVFHQNGRNEYFWSSSLEVANSYKEAECKCRASGGGLAFVTNSFSEFFTEQIGLTDLGK